MLSVVKSYNDYTPEDKESAYVIYKDPKQGGRSLRKTARITEIPFATLQYWNRTLGWQQRMWDEDQREAALIDQTVKLRLVNELDGLMDNLIYLAYHGTNEDKVKADMTKHALSIASFSAIQKVQQDITQVVEARHSIREDDAAIETLSLEDLADQLTKKMRALTGGDEGAPVTEGSEPDDSSPEPDRAQFHGGTTGDADGEENDR